MSDMQRIKAMLTIVNRGDGLAMCKLYNRNGILLHIQSVGIGTASSELLGILGLSQREKDLLISFATEAVIDSMLDRLDDVLRGLLRVRGIVLSLPISGISNLIATALNDQYGGGPAMEHPNEKAFSLILALVNQGCTDTVMQTAVKAGATGGTVVRARWVGADHLEQFFGITLQDEKEILAIACAKEHRNAIMDAINEHHGLHTEEQAMLCSLPADRMIRLT